MGGILLKGGGLEEESIRDLVQEAIGSCSPLELTATWVFLEVLVSAFGTHLWKWLPCPCNGHPWKWLQGSVAELVLVPIQLIFGVRLMWEKRVVRPQLFSSWQILPGHL